MKSQRVAKIEKSSGSSPTKKKSPNQRTSPESKLGPKRNSTDSFEIDVDSLVKHALICGVTGSGKTNTCFNILEKLEKHQIPFLVMEPAKSEYRSLAIGSKSIAGSIQIYTLGDESTSPFRLNPFEIMQRVKVSAHIEALKTIFIASFEMSPPMSQVLEKALKSIYTVRGWELVQNKNLRLPAGINPGDPNCPSGIHPTMKDLQDTLAEMSESFGYPEHIVSEVKATLAGRIAGLLAEATGRVLSSRKSVNLASLFSKPAIIELRNIFSDKEKSFFASTLLLFLSEHRKSNGFREELKHALIIEDGHRLLKHLDDSGAGDKHSRVGFIDFFSDLLSEMRSYGQGIIVSTQNPGRLNAEVLSNTNLKIIHRLSTSTDLDAVSGSTFLKQHHRDRIVTLSPGEALVYGEGMALPEDFKTSNFSKKLNSPLLPSQSDSAVKALMTGVVATNASPIGCDFCSDPEVSEAASLVASDRSFRLVNSDYILATMKDTSQLVHFQIKILIEIQRVLGRNSANMICVTWCALCQAAERYFDLKGQENFWFYDEVEEQQIAWLDLLKPTFLSSTETRRLDLSELTTWRDNFVKLQEREQGPLTACGSCTSRCFYRLEVSEILKDPNILSDFNSCINREHMSASENAAWFCRFLSESRLGEFDIDHAYCFAIHLIREQCLSKDAQLVLLFKIRQCLETFEKDERPNSDSGGIY